VEYAILARLDDIDTRPRRIEVTVGAIERTPQQPS